MKKVKIITDIIMFVIMVSLMKIKITGPDLHEIFGICIFAVFVLHKVLNFKWVKSVGKNIFSKKMKARSRVLFLLDALLLVLVTLNVVSGILISNFVLTGISAPDICFATGMHKFFAWWSLILISVHIGFHLDRTVGFFKKKIRILNSKTAKIIFVCIYIAVAIVGIFSLAKQSVYKNLVPTLSEQCQSTRYADEPNLVQENKAQRNIPTLEEYLSQFTCGGCRKNCSLLNPKCETGREKREQKIEEYYQLYQSTEEDTVTEEETENITSEQTPTEEDATDAPTESITDTQTDTEQTSTESPTHSARPEKPTKKSKTNIVNILSIIWLFAGGTYYILKIASKK